jgi:hypothetical protein
VSIRHWVLYGIIGGVVRISRKILDIHNLRVRIDQASISSILMSKILMMAYSSDGAGATTPSTVSQQIDKCSFSAGAIIVRRPPH